MEVVKRISPRAEQLISEYGLGYIRVEYSENVLKRGLIFIALLPVGFVMLALSLPTLLAPALTDGDWWQRMGNLSYFLMGGSCLSLLGIPGICMLAITLWKGEKRLYLGDKGFVSARRQIETVVRWETVAEIHRHILFMKGKSEKV